MSVRVAVFASGGGTTFQALIDHVRTAAAPTWTVALVVSDRGDAGVLERAARAGVPGVVISDRGRQPTEVAADTLQALAEREIDVVCLAGYLRLVPSEVVAAFEGRMLNVHPALLPSFGGKGMYGDRVHGAVLASGARVSGPTVHLVDGQYDRGLPLAQWPVPVLSGDTTGVLRARVQGAERALYPIVVDHLARSIRAGSAPSPLSVRHGAFTAAGDAGAHASDEVIRTIMNQAFHQEEEPRSE